MPANPLVQLEVQPSQRSAILEFGLIVNVCCAEAVDLDAAYDLFSLQFLTFEYDPFVVSTTRG